MNVEQKEVLNVEELANYTGWSKSYIWKKTSDGSLQFSKPLGKTIFFSKKWVDEFLLSKPNVTKAQRESQAATYVALKKGGAKC